MTCQATCKTPTPAQAHCSTCHRTFGGVTGGRDAAAVTDLVPTQRPTDQLARHVTASLLVRAN